MTALKLSDNIYIKFCFSFRLSLLGFLVDFLFFIKKRRFLSVFLLLGVFIFLAVSSLVKKSATFDESNHLVRGLYPLSGKGYTLNKEHPPLVNFLQGLPVHFTMNVKLSTVESNMHPFFHYSRSVLWGGANDGKEMIFRARLVTVFLSVLLGVLIYWWANDLYGFQGGILSLALFCFSPTILANSRLVTTDAGLAFFLFAYYFALWKLIQSPSHKKTVITGLCLGAGIGSKHLALLSIPISLVVLSLVQYFGKLQLIPAVPFVSKIGSDPLIRRRGVLLAWVVWLEIVLIAFIVVWGLYGFSLGPIRGTGMMVPMPDYFEGLNQGWNSLKSGRLYYLDGHISENGWYVYFLKAFLYKTPIPLLLILFGACVWRLLDKPRVAKEMGWIALAVFCFALALIGKKVNLGSRYLLSVYPFLFLFAGSLARIPKFKFALIALVGWLALEILVAHPNYISYFNQSFSPNEKRLHLVDSSLDWGQDLPALANWQKENGIETLRLGYFGTANPEAYGVKYESLPFFLQEKWTGTSKLELNGVIVVSATLLQGLYNRPAEYFAPLRERKPDVIIGDGSILIFDLR